MRSRVLWLQRLVAKLKGFDDFYAELDEKRLRAYQRLFDRALTSLDVETQTAWSRGEEYDRNRFEKDGEVLEKLCEDANEQGLNSTFFAVMVHQYIFADPREREWDQERWASRVIRRKEVDYFPSGWVMFKLLERIT